MTGAEANGTDCSAGVTLTWSTTASSAANYKVLGWTPATDSSNYTTLYSGSALTYTIPVETTGVYGYQVIVEDSSGKDIGQSNAITVDWSTCTINNNPDPSTVAIVGSAVIGTNTVG